MKKYFIYSYFLRYLWQGIRGGLIISLFYFVILRPKYQNNFQGFLAILIQILTAIIFSFGIYLVKKTKSVLYSLECLKISKQYYKVFIVIIANFLGVFCFSFFVAHILHIPHLVQTTIVVDKESFFLIIFKSILCILLLGTGSLLTKITKNVIFLMLSVAIFVYFGFFHGVVVISNEVLNLLYFRQINFILIMVVILGNLIGGILIWLIEKYLMKLKSVYNSEV